MQLSGGILVAKHAADEAWARDVAATPVDDAAWEQELERRRLVELGLKAKK
jgi:hypothetical protein